MKHIAFLAIIALLALPACKKDKGRVIDSGYQPDVNPKNFANSTDITNPYFPITAGKTYIYEGQTAGGLERDEEQRLTTTKVIMGITCVVDNFKAYLDGKLIEEAWDWYAQDNEGTVWYFGEAVDNYNPDGSLKDHDGSWQAGIDGAQPDIIMLADPQVGKKYREEYYFNVAEDEAQVIETGLTVTIPLNTYNNCIKTRNWTALEPGQIEQKYYAPGIGVIKEVDADNAEITLKAIN